MEKLHKSVSKSHANGAVVGFIVCVGKSEGREVGEEGAGVPVGAGVGKTLGAGTGISEGSKLGSKVGAKLIVGTGEFDGAVDGAAWKARKSSIAISLKSPPTVALKRIALEPLGSDTVARSLRCLKRTGELRKVTMVTLFQRSCKTRTIRYLDSLTYSIVLSMLYHHMSEMLKNPCHIPT